VQGGKNRIRLYRTEAIVLRHRDYGEADRILTIYTPELGKLEVIGKGVRKPTSRKAGHLEPFTRVSLLLAESRSWDIVTQAEAIETFPNLRQSLDSIAAASYMVELVDRFAQEGDRNPGVYELLEESLRALDAGDDIPLLLRFFEIELVGLEGYRPELRKCVACGRELMPVNSFFSVEMGGALCPDCGKSIPSIPMPLNVFKVMRFLQSKPYSEVRQLQVSKRTLDQVEQITFRYLVHYLEKKPRSAGFIRRLRKMKGE